MKNNTYLNIYSKIILEEALNQVENSVFPQPFNQLLLHLKQSMLKALNAAQEQLVSINNEVNIWRNKLITAWKNFSNQLTNEQKISLNNILLDLINKYTIYMHRCKYWLLILKFIYFNYFKIHLF